MSEKEKSNSLRRAIELGWDAIVWNTYIAGKLPSKPPAYNPPSTTAFSRVYNRLTVPFDEVVDAQTVTGSTEFARSYDIIAACPMNAKVFSYLCKNIILSSGADSYLHLRGPHDAMNMAEILKLNRKQAMDAVSSNCENVLKHAMARKQRYLPIEIIPTPANLSERFPEYSASVKGSGKEKKTARNMKIRKNLREEQDSAEISDVTNRNRKRARKEPIKDEDNDAGSDDDSYDGVQRKELKEAKGQGSFIDEDFIRL
eukprot:gene24983-32554_t